MAIRILQFDPDNLQQDYQYIAKSLNTGEDVIGAVVADKPLNMSGIEATYYILTPSFNNDSLRSMRFSRHKVDKDSIRPYTQSEEVKYLLSKGDSVELVEIVHETPTSITEKTLADLMPHDKVPYELWKKESDDELTLAMNMPEEEIESEPEESDELPTIEQVHEPKKRGRKKKNP